MVSDRLRAGVHQLNQYVLGWLIGGLIVMLTILIVKAIL